MLFAATRAPQGSNRQGFRFVVLRDGPNARVARGILAAGAERLWGSKRVADGYRDGSGAAPNTPKARMTATMEHFTDHFGEAPVILLACLWLHREASLTMGGSIFPAIQNLLLAAPAGPFRLTARADGIDRREDGGLVITDYKTGRAPDDKRVTSALAPQLPLEAAIGLAGGFEGLAAGPVAVLRYVSASGAEPPGEERQIKCDDIAALAKRMLSGLERLISAYDDPATGYRAVRRPAFKDGYRYDDYAHLARVKEWGEGGSDD